MSDMDPVSVKRIKGYDVEVTVDDWYDFVKISKNGKVVYETYGHFSHGDLIDMVDKLDD